MVMHMAQGAAMAGSALQRLQSQLLSRVQVRCPADCTLQQLHKIEISTTGCASHKFGHGAEHDEALHGARRSDMDGGECIAEVAIPGAAKGAGEMVSSAERGQLDSL
jgi:hypothetical protein